MNNLLIIKPYIMENNNSLNYNATINPKELSSDDVSSAMSQAEARLETWKNKSYYERIACLAKVADQMPNKTDLLSVMITFEINKLLAESYQEITLL
jgi:acyl-CoA reductase-like NAD-dependent aldehyde dehydrogenase